MQVGDVIQLAEEEQAPADMVLVSTSSPHGICFIETSNLDGESNHKMRLAPPTTQVCVAVCGCMCAPVWLCVVVCVRLCGWVSAEWMNGGRVPPLIRYL